METSNVKEDLITVIVMGGEGSGKSTFISNILGNDIGVSHAMSNNEGVKDHQASFESRRVVLREVPDLASLSPSELDELKKLLDDLTAKVSAIYLYRVNEGRITGTMKKEFRQLCVLCKDIPASRITFVSTHWDEGSRLIDGKEDAITESLYGPFIHKGAKTDKLEPKPNNLPFSNNPIDLEDAKRILRKVMVAKDSERPAAMGSLDGTSNGIQTRQFTIKMQGSPPISGTPIEIGILKHPNSSPRNPQTPEVARNGTGDKRTLTNTPSTNIVADNMKNLPGIPPTSGGAREKINNAVETKPKKENLSPRPTAKFDTRKRIILMGATGTGKSTFIRNILGKGIDDGLKSCTKQISEYETKFGRKHGFLVDTPGFDESGGPDIVILQKISEWLKAKAVRESAIAGIIYLHKIGDIHMLGSLQRNLEDFRALYSDKYSPQIVIVTTHWAYKGYEQFKDQEKCESTFKDTWQNEPLSKGAHFDRLEFSSSDHPFPGNTIKTNDAQRILRTVLNAKGKRREVVNQLRRRERKQPEKPKDDAAARQLSGIEDDLKSSRGKRLLDKIRSGI